MLFDVHGELFFQCERLRPELALVGWGERAIARILAGIPFDFPADQRCTSVRISIKCFGQVLECRALSAESQNPRVTLFRAAPLDSDERSISFELKTSPPSDPKARL
jgi:hypothetical protein